MWLLLMFAPVFFTGCWNKKDVNMSNEQAKYALIRTNKGDIVFEFRDDKAPNHCKRLRELISQGFYDGLKFHRVVPGFVVQTGDPTGTGAGGSGQNLKAEFNDLKHIDGAMGMARAMDPNSADSQFYITLGTFPHLDGQYTVFGYVVKGLDVAHKLVQGDKIEKMELIDSLDNIK